MTWHRNNRQGGPRHDRSERGIIRLFRGHWAAGCTNMYVQCTKLYRLNGASRAEGGRDTPWPGAVPVADRATGCIGTKRMSKPITFLERLERIPAESASGPQ
jgi:hypothetical protein